MHSHECVNLINDTELVCSEKRQITELRVEIMSCINDDWEHQVGVNPLLQDMHCGEEYFTTTQDVSFRIFYYFIYSIIHFCVLPNLKFKFSTCYPHKKQN